MSVRDTGLGIPADMLPRVFDMFAQVDRTLKRSQGGLGIGLTLARTLVEMHGGRVEARSGGPGQGSEFIVRLPTGSPEESVAGSPARQRPASRRTDASSASWWSMTTATRRTVSACCSSTWEPTPTWSTTDRPHWKLSAPTARRSCSWTSACPGMDGHEVARQVRQEPEFRDVKLIAMTGWGQEEDRRRSKAAGFDHHLVKPANVETLQALLASLPVKCASEN